MAALVTIGIPFRDEGQMLELAIRSVFAQTYENWELILIDDGADDATRSIAESVRHDRVRLVGDGLNLGLATRLNQIARLANGKYIARMDADDVMHPERLEKQVSYLEQHAFVDVLGTATYVIDVNNRPVGIRGTGELDLRPSVIISRTPLIHPTVMARTEWMRENPYDESYLRAQDRELWFRTHAYSRFECIREPLLFYREVGAFSWQKYRLSMKMDRKILLQHGPKYLGWPKTVIKLLETWVKLATYTLLDIAGSTDLMLSRRSSSLTIDEQERANQALQRVASTHVPGLPKIQCDQRRKSASGE